MVHIEGPGHQQVAADVQLAFYPHAGRVLIRHRGHELLFRRDHGGIRLVHGRIVHFPDLAIHTAVQHSVVRTPQQHAVHVAQLAAFLYGEAVAVVEVQDAGVLQKPGGRHNDLAVRRVDGASILQRPVAVDAARVTEVAGNLRFGAAVDSQAAAVVEAIGVDAQQVVLVDVLH